MINKIILGTVQFGMNYGISNVNGKISKKDVQIILDTCKKNKILHIDTASVYGNSEKILGDIGINDFNVISKFISNNLDDLNRELNLTLQNLDQKSIYGYLAHRPLHVINNKVIWDNLLKLKSNGIISKIGFSINDSIELEKIINNGFIPDIIQVPYNLLDQRFRNYINEFKIKFNTEIHSRSTFLQGLFFINYKHLPVELKPFEKSIKSIQNVCENNNITIAKFALNFMLQNKSIDKTLIGITNIDEFNELLNSSKYIDISELVKEIIPLDYNFQKLLNPSNWQL